MMFGESDGSSMLLIIEGILFFVGLIILVTGRVQAGRMGKLITGQRARWIGLLLMSPVPLNFCASSVIMFSYIDLLMSLAESGDALNPQALLDALPPETLNSLSVAGLIIPIAVFGLAAYLFYTAPAESLASSPQPTDATGRPLTFTPAPVASGPPPLDFGKVLTVAEAARYLKVSDTDVLDLINNGKLPASRIGSDYRIARSAIDDMLTGSL
jgi:excisionase family DNA binding protein